MRQLIFLVLIGCLLLCLCGCNRVDSQYSKLIAAIEADDYSQALTELQTLMNIPPTSPEEPRAPKDNETICSHRGSDATCTQASICTDCGTEITAALSHDYQDSVCTRCGEEDPADAAKLKAYQTAMSHIKNYEQSGAFSTADTGRLIGSAAVGYIYQELSALKDYRDCADYLSRITIVSDKLLSISLKETDNLGNVENNTTIDYEYDPQGRVIMSEDIRFNEQFGIYLLDSFSQLLQGEYAHGGSQYYTKLIYGEDNRITEIQCYYVSLRAIITPSYDENGRINSANYRLNTDSGTLSFTYDEIGRLIDITSSLPAQLTYQYAADGKVLSKNDRLYTYDAQGSLTGWTSDSASCTVRNDAQGRILQEHTINTDGQTVYDYHYGDYYIYQPSDAA